MLSSGYQADVILCLKHMTCYEGPLHAVIYSSRRTRSRKGTCACRYIQTYGTHTHTQYNAHKQTHAHAIKVTAVVMMEHSEKGK